MRRMGAGGLLGTAFWLAMVSAAVGAGAAEIDPQTGFAVDSRLPLVRAHCTGCHSAKLVTQYRASREGWLSVIRWMQRTQKLWTFPPETEADLLDYLAEHYGLIEIRGRRRPLEASLLPPPRLTE